MAEAHCCTEIDEGVGRIFESAACGGLRCNPFACEEVNSAFPLLDVRSVDGRCQLVRAFSSSSEFDLRRPVVLIGQSSGHHEQQRVKTMDEHPVSLTRFSVHRCKQAQRRTELRTARHVGAEHHCEERVSGGHRLVAEAERGRMCPAPGIIARVLATAPPIRHADPATLSVLPTGGGGGESRFLPTFQGRTRQLCRHRLRHDEGLRWSRMARWKGRSTSLLVAAQDRWGERIGAASTSGLTPRMEGHARRAGGTGCSDRR